MTPIAAQIDSVTAPLNTKSARLQELVLRDGTDGSLEPAEVTERDTLTGEVDTLATRLKSLRAIEAAQAGLVRPVYAGAPPVQTKAVEPYVPRVEVKSTLAPGQEFARYVICRMAAIKSGTPALEFAKHYYPDNPRIQALIKTTDLLQKDNVPAGTSTDATFAGPLVYAQQLANEFVEFLRPQTVLGRIPGLRRVPFNVRITGQTSGATGYWVGQGQAKPLTRYGFNAQTLAYHKVAAIISITDELARFSSPSAEMLVRDELVNALRERLDLDFLDPAKAATANVSPASITNGVTNLNDTGATLANTITDIQQFFNAMINNNFDLAQCVWIMPTSVAMQLSLMRDSLGQTAFPTISVNGGTWQGIPVIVSQYLVFGHTPANNKVILVHTPSIAVADDGGFQVDMSREASLEMDDQPVMSSSSIGATPGSPTGPTGSALVSMFQTNSIAIRAERYITWARLRTGAVVWMDDVRWAA
jgi:HK97 family phage major capsid protein